MDASYIRLSHSWSGFICVIVIRMAVDVLWIDDWYYDSVMIMMIKNANKRPLACQSNSDVNQNKSWFWSWLVLIRKVKDDL